ncbi:hypothetical protein Pmar_PMAR018633 [Perkinsus marinus ATCC 50983]|uniref:Uncharacterized protein n=1 Tax=Perkinsus marinus (strain ATCC 50983 / TXsc) TaxID=423536 RepID=C5L0D0_PERM5|nr:hypothetical protein Pmar_PMAR018633 [Perkinsus marinus ATCC 50983]EER09988.1 hypothetical protein Pmar_PMAR018633 [Perkinsus marinus ATCC 50983]|eukprot:XP_002778193.1 hypothetical protein Pmar_PMAR018633 [Perkinsus marinus ATCC 50983]
MAGAGDIRHILKTVARRHVDEPPLHFYVHESSPETIARHIFFLDLVTNPALTIRERCELFLSLYANSLVRKKDARYLGEQVGRLQALVSGDAEDDPSLSGLSKLIDLSTLKFRDRDDVHEAIGFWGESVEFDARSLRDQRLRGYYKTRYDHRKNLLDWDYHNGIKPMAPAVHWQISNEQYVHSSHEIADFNLACILAEIATRQVKKLPPKSKDEDSYPYKSPLERVRCTVEEVDDDAGVTEGVKERLLPPGFQNVRIHFLSGNLSSNILQRQRYKRYFDRIYVGCLEVNGLMGEESGQAFAEAMVTGCGSRLSVEAFKHQVCLSGKQKLAVRKKVQEACERIGLEPVADHMKAPSVTEVLRKLRLGLPGDFRQCCGILSSTDELLLEP